MYGKPYQNSISAKNTILGLTLFKNLFKLNKKGYLTRLKPEQSHKTGFRDKGF